MQVTIIAGSSWKLAVISATSTIPVSGARTVAANNAPLAATALKNIFGTYNAAFAAAAIGMVFSLIIFEAGKKFYIHAEDKRHEEKADTNYVKVTKQQEKERIGALMLIFAIVIFFLRP